LLFQLHHSPSNQSFPQNLPSPSSVISSNSTTANSTVCDNMHSNVVSSNQNHISNLGSVNNVIGNHNETNKNITKNIHLDKSESIRKEILPRKNSESAEINFLTRNDNSSINPSENLETNNKSHVLPSLTVSSLSFPKDILNPSKRFRKTSTSPVEQYSDRNRLTELNFMCENSRTANIVQINYPTKSEEVKHSSQTSNKNDIKSQLSNSSFSWSDYIENKCFLAAPVHFFKHAALFNLWQYIKTNVHVEVPNKHLPPLELINENLDLLGTYTGSYWFASIVQIGKYYINFLNIKKSFLLSLFSSSSSSSF
jgi:hypothetical protein